MPATLPIGPGLTLRSEGPDDLAFIERLFTDDRSEELAAIPWPPAAKQALLADQFRLQTAHFSRAYPTLERWIVLAAGEPVGRLYLDREGPCWTVVEIGIVRPRRGGGLGSAVLRWVLGQATALAADVGLHVARDNEGAARLYRRLGFVEQGPGAATHATMRWTAS